MYFIFSTKLSQIQTDQVQALYADIEFSSIEQFPGFADAAYPNEKIIHALMFVNNSLTGYSQIRIKKRLFASVYFGPLVKNEQEYLDFVKRIKNYCRNNWTPILKIFPPEYTGKYKTSFWNKLKNNTHFETSENEFNWATLLLKIGLSDDIIFKKIADNHQQSIKKAIKLGLTTTVLDVKDLTLFNKQYCEMYASRKLNIDSELNLKKFTQLFHFFKNNNNGFFMGVWLNNQLIGGTCIAFENNVAFYLEGYSNPEYRKLPIGHIALYESMKIARNNGLNYFDFGGYALNTKEGDQLQKINKFKEGFRGELITYPKTMTFYTFFPAKWLWKLYQKSSKFKVQS